MKKTISIVLPVYNEKDHIEDTLKKIMSLKNINKKYFVNIIISDSNSLDGTAEIGKRYAKKYKNIHYISVGRGLGVGLYKGHKYSLKNTNPDIMVQIDADGQVHPNTIMRLVDTVEKGYDLAIGSRFVRGGKNNLPILRKIFTTGSSLLCRSIMGPLNIKEFTNSARAFTADIYKKINWSRIPWKENTFIIMPAFINEAVIAGASYKEVPIVFKVRSTGYSKNRVFYYTVSLVKYILKSRFKKQD